MHGFVNFPDESFGAYEFGVDHISPLTAAHLPERGVGDVFHGSQYNGLMGYGQLWILHSQKIRKLWRKLLI